MLLRTQVKKSKFREPGGSKKKKNDAVAAGTGEVVKAELVERPREYVVTLHFPEVENKCGLPIYIRSIWVAALVRRLGVGVVRRFLVQICVGVGSVGWCLVAVTDGGNEGGTAFGLISCASLRARTVHESHHSFLVRNYVVSVKQCLSDLEAEAMSNPAGTGQIRHPRAAKASA